MWNEFKKKTLLNTKTVFIGIRQTCDAMQCKHLLVIFSLFVITVKQKNGINWQDDKYISSPDSSWNFHTKNVVKTWTHLRIGFHNYLIDLNFEKKLLCIEWSSLSLHLYYLTELKEDLIWHKKTYRKHVSTLE